MSGERIETAGGVREQIVRVLQREFGGFLARDPHDPDRFWSQAADAVLPLIAEAEARGAQAALRGVEALASEYEADDAMHLAAFGQHHPVAYSAGRHLRDLLGEQAGDDR